MLARAPHVRICRRPDCCAKGQRPALGVLVLPHDRFAEQIAQFAELQRCPGGEREGALGRRAGRRGQVQRQHAAATQHAQERSQDLA